jgi:hypothetical protein
MIKKFKIFEQIRAEIDPYGEEDWEEDNLTHVLQIARKQGQGKPFDEITTLYCYDNQLTTLEGIENLVNLQYLYCSNNQLTSLEGIENLVNLKFLYCDNNQLTTLEGIENLVNLQYLSCNNNQLTSLEGIENLVNLKELLCGNNQFSNDYIKYLRDYCKKKKITYVI